MDIVEGDLRRAMRLRARGDEDHIALEPARAVGSRDHNRVTVFEGRLAANELNLVQRQILQNPAALHVHDFAFVMHEVVHSEILFERVIDAIKTALFQAREIERRFAQSLAGNGTSIDATAAQVLGAFDQGDALAKIGGLGARLFAGRTAAHHNQVKTFSRTHSSLPVMSWKGLTLRHALRIWEDSRGRAGENKEVSRRGVPNRTARAPPESA